MIKTDKQKHTIQEFRQPGVRLNMSLMREAGVDRDAALEAEQSY